MIFLFLSGCGSKSVPAEETQHVISSCQLPLEGKCQIYPELLVRRTEGNHKHRVDGGVDSFVYLEIQKAGETSSIRLQGGEVYEEKVDDLYLQVRTKKEESAISEVHWGTSTNHPEDWIKKTVSFPKNCGSIEMIRSDVERGLWVVLSEQGCRETWGRYSGERIRFDHRFEGSCTLDEQQNNCPFRTELDTTSFWVHTNEESGPLTNVIEKSVLLGLGEQEIDVVVVDRIEMIFANHLLQIQEKKEGEIHIEYRPLKKELSRTQLKRKSRFPKDCGEIKKVKEKGTFLTMGTINGCYIQISKYTGEIWSTSFVVKPY